MLFSDQNLNTHINVQCQISCDNIMWCCHNDNFQLILGKAKELQTQQSMKCKWIRCEGTQSWSSVQCANLLICQNKFIIIRTEHQDYDESWGTAGKTTTQAVQHNTIIEKNSIMRDYEALYAKQLKSIENLLWHGTLKTTR